jgi:hypothetical protein
MTGMYILIEIVMATAVTYTCPNISYSPTWDRAGAMKISDNIVGQIV